MGIRRIFVEKKEGFDIPAKRVLSDVNSVLNIPATDVKIYLRYDVEGIEADADFKNACENVFSEPPADTVYHGSLPKLDGYKVFGTEYLLGQYDQRADSAGQCAELLLNKNRPRVKTATYYAIKGVSDKELEAVKKYLINPTDSKIADDVLPDTLDFSANDRDEIDYADGFINFTDNEISDFHKQNGFAMSVKDLAFVKEYFKGAGRNPTVTELKVIDTYWSDHCRHTTFLTELQNVDLGGNIDAEAGYALYKTLFNDIYKNRKDKYVCLMDIATIGAKALKKEGKLGDLDESDEINACSVKVKALVDGKPEDWLVMFKNETHNHPTEIEPFGGAATCLGGAIRDPLSGRVFVYQAMRVTGAGDIFKPVGETLPGKLPQRVISKTAAAGFSSYGNQIGLATGEVKEYYHDGYTAKRLETGFVVGAAPAENVIRKAPEKGDKVILIGGETGRDGCGGATGSSKAHNKESVNECGAEVQKGNPLTERKIQRFFRNGKATRLIKRCNDFGAGGVSVAIGELAEGLDIWLDKVPKKYKGLTVTETAISESQERMAVVVSEKDAAEFLSYVKEENLDAAIVAEVTDLARMRMFNKGKTVVDIERSFLDTNGVKQAVDVKLRKLPEKDIFAPRGSDLKEALGKKDYLNALKFVLKDKNVMLQKGLSETFDSTIGTASVFMPFGGKSALTPSSVMAARLPVRNGMTDTVSVVAHALDPFLTDNNPYIGGMYAVIASVAKIVAAGVDYRSVRLTLQEFFKRLNGNPERFGEPFAALLGALFAQYNLGTAAIGGKDSMSGSFEDIDVPNTLISFAVAVTEGKKLISNVFEKGMSIYRLPLGKSNVPDFAYVKKLFEKIYDEITAGSIKAAAVTEAGGAIAAIVKSAIGNGCGVEFVGDLDALFENRPGDFLIATENPSAFEGFIIEKAAIINGGEFTLSGETLTKQEAYSLLSGFEKVYPVHASSAGKAVNASSDKSFAYPINKAVFAKPRVFIPVFPGTNCEYDTARRFEKEGAIADIFVIKNKNSAEITESVNEIIRRVKKSQIIAFPGGFSGGDEPDGSGKFIASTFRNPYIAEKVNELIKNRDGLILGICNGFQALVKLGLLPYGEITALNENSPTLTFNNINRHVSAIVRTRIASNASPWLSAFSVGDVFSVPVSHGEGRFYATDFELSKIIANNQIATQYADEDGNATMDTPFNPNGSLNAIEGLISVDGRIFGKMGHTERFSKGLYKNIPAEFDMNIFSGGVGYYK